VNDEENERNEPCSRSFRPFPKLLRTTMVIAKVPRSSTEATESWKNCIKEWKVRRRVETGWERRGEDEPVSIRSRGLRLGRRLRREEISTNQAKEQDIEEERGRLTELRRERDEGRSGVQERAEVRDDDEVKSEAENLRSREMMSWELREGADEEEKERLTCSPIEIQPGGFLSFLTPSSRRKRAAP